MGYADDLASGLAAALKGVALTAADQSKMIADEARAELAELIGDGDAPADYETIVDGVAGRNENDVKAGGRIEYRFGNLAGAAQFALDWLRDHSPVKSGRYRDAHEALVDNEAIDPARLPAGADAVTITNPEPYARILDVGTSRLHLPLGLYEHARIVVNQQYGDRVSVAFAMVALPDAYVLKRTGRRGRKDAAGTPITYPALVLKPR